MKEEQALQVAGDGSNESQTLGDAAKVEEMPIDTTQVGWGGASRARQRERSRTPRMASALQQSCDLDGQNDESRCTAPIVFPRAFVWKVNASSPLLPTRFLAYNLEKAVFGIMRLERFCWSLLISDSTPRRAGVPRGSVSATDAASASCTSSAWATDVAGSAASCSASERAAFSREMASATFLGGSKLILSTSWSTVTFFFFTPFPPEKFVCSYLPEPPLSPAVAFCLTLCGQAILQMWPSVST
ncbi:hypothetical protein AK812_SmicGene5758 [Symbiodinium microadriaticum]|uniref:Uncharacterized protein n=1 Tax=Symbiodinium microadriaticum TaxID=2951 RepID=A0A1Q9ET17_SYMMI|nr:hypothetical protein AK812_SmicGene5758 [Symbiodinium microadriaticum]